MKPSLRFSPVLGVVLLAIGCAECVAAQDAQTILAQQLVDEFKAGHSEVLSIGIHAKPPGKSAYVIIAHTNRASVGHRSEGADLITLKTGNPDGPNALADGVFDVGVRLKDSRGNNVGFVAVHVRPPAAAGDPKAQALQTALQMAKDLSARIPSQRALFKAID
jgi:hypothetical protein